MIELTEAHLDDEEILTTKDEFCAFADIFLDAYSLAFMRSLDLQNTGLDEQDHKEMWLESFELNHCN